MNHHPEASRRAFLRRSTGAVGAGGLGLYSQLVLAARQNGGHSLAPQPAHFPPRAKQLILILLAGGMSHVDTFDYKPRLKKDETKKIFSGPLIPSPFKFRPCGAAGIPVSELFPKLGSMIDQWCLIRSVQNLSTNHFEATLAMLTGSATVPMPSLGSWISYGLGTLNPNLPSFFVLAEKMVSGGVQAYQSGFLPAHHQGVRVIPGAVPIPNLEPAIESVTLRELELRMLRDVDTRHAVAREHDLGLRARISSFDVAGGMMRVAPEAFDVSRETADTHQMYGLVPEDRTSFGWQCLTARRLVERGVRVVELYHTGKKTNWDQHGDMDEHRVLARQIDQPVSALVTDLARRGLLDDTLVVLCTEFGRRPFSKTNEYTKGREHHHLAFTCAMAGGGVRGGMVYGKTDDYGNLVVENAVHLHDFHATILHLMGLDHEKLTYRYAGRDFRLTDVSGKAVTDIMV